MNPPRVVGLDLSPDATGIALGLTAGAITTIKPASPPGIPRLAEIRDVVVACCSGAGVVGIEGYSFASKTSYARYLAGLGHVVRLALWEAGIPYVDVSPSSVKKLATGNGSAAKEAVLVQAIKRLGYDGHDLNQADALWVREFVLQGLGFGSVSLPKVHLEALYPKPRKGKASPFDWDAIRRDLKLAA